MILPEVNVLLHSVNSAAPQHARASALVSDAHLATLAIEHGAALLSFDADFARFAGLRFTHLR